MDVYEAVRTVLAVRKYQSKPVPAEIGQRILEAARLTGSSMNQQPWHFILVDDPKLLHQLGAMAQTGPYIVQAPMAVVVVIDPTPSAESDASRAIQSMLLTAWSEGVGSNWVGANGLEAAYALLGIPEGKRIYAVIPLGYPENPTSKGKKNRKPFAEVISRNRYGSH